MALFNFKRDAKPIREEPLSLENIPVELIIPNPNQPRRIFDENGIRELADSIKEVGLIQPLIVRERGEYYELISGERRLRAVTLLNYYDVKCLVARTVGDGESALMAIIENLQREDLNYFEEAECYANLLQTLGVTQEQLAQKLGKSQSYIANKLRLLKFTPELRNSITEAALTERHARALLKLSDEEALGSLINEIIERSLTVKETERAVEKYSRKSSVSIGSKEHKPKIIRVIKDYNVFINSINTACELLRESGLTVLVDRSDRDNGVDIIIKVTRN